MTQSPNHSPTVLPGLWLTHLQQISYLSAAIKKWEKRQIKISGIVPPALPADLAVLIIINSPKLRATAELRIKT